MQRRIIIYRFVYTYMYRAHFGIITNARKRHCEIDGSIWKIRAGHAICNRLAKHDWSITNSLGKWNESPRRLAESHAGVRWRLKLLRIRYFVSDPDICIIRIAIYRFIFIYMFKTRLYYKTTVISLAWNKSKWTNKLNRVQTEKVQCVIWLFSRTWHF